MALRLTGQSLSKAFNRRTIFRDITFTVADGETLLIAGRNGSGKSTLVKILCGILTPGSGKVELDGAGAIDEFSRKDLFGFVAPYLQLYDEFTAMENLHLGAALRGLHGDAQEHAALLRRLALDPTRNDPVHGFSSGMKQRLKYALALAHQPRILVLDEPMSNLDADGTSIVREIMREQRSRGILVVATNDLTDTESFDGKVDLNARG
jgi:heme exporter protein A